ncbi:MAG: alpha/beta fold hydrolase [Sphingomonadales bacterium]|nr:alpha/beta fold hydrolase [Sphingomonadales bacterium]
MVSAALESAQTVVERTIQRNLKGLGYLASPAPVLGTSAKDVIVSRGPMRLYHYHPLVDEVYRVPVLLVMATTNRGYIFDMVPGQSMVEFLLLRGYDVFMLDWEAPRPEDRGLAMKDYVEDFVGGAIAEVQRTTGEPDVSLVGYCMGGVLSTLWSGLNHAQGPKNLAVFTTPVDFRQMTLFRAWSDPRYFDVDRLVDTLGMAPADMLLTAFDMLRPAGRASANFALLDNLWNDDFVKAHRMFDRWSNDMLPLAGEYFRETVKQLTWENRLLEGTMKIGGRPVELDRISCPFLHVTAEHDHIVTTEASAPLIGLIGSTDKEQVVLKGGHVSLIAGPNAVKRMWPKLDSWLGAKSV